MKEDYLDKCIKKSILCWLATVDKAGSPNVSPKEIFDLYDSETLIIANIASPKSVKNIREYDQVCVSMIDIFEQVGCKLKGRANIINHASPKFEAYSQILEMKTAGKYPFKEVIEVSIESESSILAPSYLFYKEETVAEKKAKAMQQYGVKPISNENP